MASYISRLRLLRVLQTRQFVPTQLRNETVARISMTEMENGRMGRGVDSENQTVTANEQSKRTRKPVKRIVGRVIEVAILTVVITAVWGLFSLPSVFFFYDLHKTNMSPSETQNTSNQSNGTTTISSSSHFLSKPANLNIICSTNFYLDPDAGFCKPECGQWKPFPDDVVLASAVIVILSSLVGIAVGILIVTISILKNKQMFKFPSILILYQNTTIALLLFVKVIGYMDTQTFLCPSRDASQSLITATPYCTLYGISLYYLVNQAVIFWVEHIAVILVLVVFPFKAKHLETSGHRKILHILMVMVALVLPIGLTAVSLGTGGFRPFYYPDTCVTSNRNALFYALVFPDSIVAALGISLLILLFWTLIRRKWIEVFISLSEKAIRKLGTQRTDPRNSAIQTTAVIKVSVSFVLFVVLTALGLTTFTITDSTQSQYTEELTEYFICESSGVRPDKVCERTYETLSNPFTSTITLLLLGICWPSINLLYVLNLKKIYFYIKQKISLSGTNNTRNKNIEI